MTSTAMFVILAGFSLAVTVKSVRADTEPRTWDEVHSGSITVPPAGAVRYEIAYSSVGYDHFEASISASWNDEGPRSQVLFSGIHDKAPAKISAVGPQLCISVEYCQRYQDDCPVWSTMYSYDHENKLFVGGTEEQRACR